MQITEGGLCGYISSPALLSGGNSRIITTKIEIVKPKNEYCPF